MTNGKTLTNTFKLPQEIVNKNTVWLVDDAMRLVPRKVTIAREEEAFFVISAGLKNNDQVVTTLPEHPQPGLEVKFAKSEAAL